MHPPRGARTRELAPEHRGELEANEIIERPAREIGIHQRAGDLTVNVCKRKAATNIRSSGADAKVPLTPPVEMGLDDALEYIEEDELVEVTPESVRIRKGPLQKKNARGPKI